MFLSDRPEAYEKVYQGLVERLAAADLRGNAALLGLDVRNGAVVAPLFGTPWLVDRDGVRPAGGGQAPVTHRIVLAYYLMHGGRGENAGRFVPYRELPGGADFARSLSTIVEGRLAGRFGGRLADLEAAAAALAGRPDEEGGRADLAAVFQALPKIPMKLSYYASDEDFPAEAKVFYDLTAPNFLDLECLAVLGLIMVLELEARAGG